MASIARILQVSKDSVQRYFDPKSKDVSQQVEASEKQKKRLTVHMDELWSFVDDKGSEQWVWFALDVDTREIVGLHFGDRSAVSARAIGVLCLRSNDNVP